MRSAASRGSGHSHTTGRYGLSPGTTAGLALLLAFFALFLFYPLANTLRSAAFVGGAFSLSSFAILVDDPVILEGILNSLNIAIIVTAFTAIVTLPLGILMTRRRFPGRSILEPLLLVPLILPPFVGAIGLSQLFARFGSVNLLLMDLGLLAPNHPIDWFGGRMLGVVVMEVLHLYPIMYLNIAAALSSVDPALEEAARNLGASGGRVFRTVTLPLMAPGIFAGAAVVFIGAFTELGTPLVFEFRKVVPVQIFDRLNETQDPTGHALVLLVLALTIAIFVAARGSFGTARYEMFARGSTATREATLSRPALAAAWIFGFGLVAISLLPHLGVLLSSVAQRWYFSVLPQEVTLSFYGSVFSHETTLPAIRKSLLYASASTVVDVVLGIFIAYVLVRKRIPFANILDATAMLPLMLPGIVLAFAYLATFGNQQFSSGLFAYAPLNPLVDPTILLIAAYAVRRLPYTVRAAYAGFQQTSVTLEEASMNLGASPARTIARITLPLIRANLLAGGILAFAFAMLEVSDSLMLALKPEYYPIAKAIYDLLGRIGDGPFIASAMGVLAMALLGVCLAVGARFLGRGLGALFRAG
jgi:iron(III) transport system permease protein